MAMPFRISAQEICLVGHIGLIFGDDLGGLHQRCGHGGIPDIKRAQHAWRVPPEPVISMNEMRQGIGGHRIGQLSSGCHHAFETCPTAGGLGCIIEMRHLSWLPAGPHRGP